ncbi:hypothetical protein BO71DRAFT_71350 [Aspergillus ellipticus CBS 707.79]|uniref:Uncharacterized protein n=1 Tax=Aspergillus ellipticus CBS 707.79 TaxID=1448320 RepID=A0A319E377_9EURO|nr:hypothetical protein BO71DRAFT_71350 [Aspergillus ellipticus CBS 707.79]
MFHDSLHLYTVRERFRMDSNDTAGARDHSRSGIGSFPSQPNLRHGLGRSGGEHCADIHDRCSSQTTISIISYVVLDLIYPLTRSFLTTHLTTHFLFFLFFIHDAFSGLSNRIPWGLGKVGRRDCAWLFCPFTTFILISYNSFVSSCSDPFSGSHAKNWSWPSAMFETLFRLHVV